MKRLNILKKDQWCCWSAFCFFSEFLGLANSIGYRWGSMIYCCRFWDYEILLKNRNCEVKKKEYFDWCHNLFFDVCQFFYYCSPLLLEFLHKDSLDICETFEMKKWKIEFLDKYKKTLDTKRARILKHNYKYVKKNPSTQLKE